MSLPAKAKAWTAATKQHMDVLAEASRWDGGSPECQRKLLSKSKNEWTNKEAIAKMHFSLGRVTLEAVISRVYLGVNQVS